jgi:hypothetical protein
MAQGRLQEPAPILTPHIPTLSETKNRKPKVENRNSSCENRLRGVAVVRRPVFEFRVSIFQFPVSSFQFLIPVMGNRLRKALHSRADRIDERGVFFEFPVSNFQFPISTFQFPVSVMAIWLLKLCRRVPIGKVNLETVPCVGPELLRQPVEAPPEDGNLKTKGASTWH